ncbi:lipoamide acyltransferase component of branched-chain alpha-keto acid dehydrogenase complex, mitochondrial-like [Macrosteles quadrilineatus]|uniref:lipoamide acyltransferase component of branched-chain alpha-keto acid dehydrogenase complex, mitochondrial-like n=1 Tax=Macrosteles quadrilineatus TaxID=74068 RepID=UPI0023E2136C|nr:lipoamide acyltransferase component of branched-chain alpha-keto acid dehydrogenase complex, mitochondrial-like [Macrosteles quadrilineatus]
MAARVLLRTAGKHVKTRGFHSGHQLGKLVQYNLTDIGEGIKEVTVRNWFVKENDEVKQFDDICEVESDKATVSITSRFDGKVTKLHYQVGDLAFVGKPLVEIDVEDDGKESEESVKKIEEPEKVKEPVKIVEEPVKNVDEKSVEEVFVTENPEESPYSEKNWNKSLATPAVRRIAMENKIKLSDVKGTGKNSRVMKEDILAYLNQSKNTTTTKTALTTVQKAMNKTMTAALKIPQFGFSDQIDVTRLVRFRKEAKEFAEKKGVKLTFLPFFIKAISKALLQYPVLNSTFDSEKEEIVYKHFHNVGVAVDSPGGLLVPNVKNVESLSIIEIARELDRLKDLAGKMKLSPADLAGGTFTISNIGNLGGTGSSPVILPPQVAILGICQIQRLPRFNSSGAVVPADILIVSWSADHRIIDGATVARCTEVFRHYLHNPSTLLLDL